MKLLCKIIFFPRDKLFFFKCLTLHIFKINKPILEFKTKQNTIRQQRLKPSLYTAVPKLRRSITLGIHIFAQLWNSFPEELEIYSEDYIHRM